MPSLSDLYIIDHLQSLCPTVKQVWYTDDATCMWPPVLSCEHGGTLLLHLDRVLVIIRMQSRPTRLSRNSFLTKQSICLKEQMSTLATVQEK